MRPLPALLTALFLLLPSPDQARPASPLGYAPDKPQRGPAQPVPATMRYGLLYLEVEPSGAHIALDGEFLDRGVWLISMAPGLHDVAVRKEGYLPWNRRIGIGPGESLRLAVRLEAVSGQ